MKAVLYFTLGENSLKWQKSLSLLKLACLLHSKQVEMSKQSIINSETQLREAARALWKEDADVRWRWKEWEPRADRGIDAIGETVLDGRRTVFLVEFKLSPGARDVEALAKRRDVHGALLARWSYAAELRGS